VKETNKTATINTSFFIAISRDESITNRLRVVPQPGQRPVFHFTLDELDELVGDVAAEANHACVLVRQAL
jgi:hypothetical protein